MSKKTYTPIIGMEVHVELKTKSGMFCACTNNPDTKEANHHICPICLGHPGTLPLVNKQAIAWTVAIGKALNCTIRPLSKFDRKHYFYPDLPKGYQISQYDQPIAEHGSFTLTFELEENNRPAATIGIRRIHLEEDTAKLIHQADGSTLVDFNRSGTPLVEIVTDPDIQSATEAKVYCQELQLLLKALQVSDADMEKGHMRCEVNISLQEEGRFDIIDGAVVPKEGYRLNAKVEIKNLNSFKAVEKAILYEIHRQTGLLEQGESWQQQTRGWDDKTGETVMQRLKENAADYRYFPEPDIPPFHPEIIAGHIALPELPIAKRQRFREEYGFSYADARLLSTDRHLAAFTEAVMSETIEWLHASPEIDKDSDEILEEKKQKIARLVGGWLGTKLQGQLYERAMVITDVRISAENFAELIFLIYTEKINSTNAQKLLADMLTLGTDVDPNHIMEEKGYGQVRDDATIQQLVDTVLISYPKQVKEYQEGKTTVLQFLVGMAMKASEGTADPQLLEQAFTNKLAIKD